jgi:aminoglycoside phosphotransferase (APT) family kinase protein
MPVPHQRDPESSRARLGRWCTKHLTGGEPATVGLLSLPDTQGFANETVPFELRWRGPDGGHQERMVARIASGGYRVYPDSRLEEQYRLTEILGRETDVPVPPVYGFEPDPDVLGAPFFVMGHVSGRVPGDLPSHHREGWVTGLTDPERETLWRSGLGAMHRVHRLDPGVLGLGFAGHTGAGLTELDRQLEHYVDNLDFFRSGSSPVALRALDWLRAHRPDRPGPAGLLWGDARLGNIVFDGLDVAAVLDWEMMSIGPAEVDLGWYLYLDRHLSEGIGVPRLTGFPSATGTVCQYAELLGRDLRDLPYYAVFAGFRFALITARVTDLLRQQKILPADVDLPLHRNAIRLLDRTIEEASGRPGHR